MNSESRPDREVLAELLLQWEELYERGQDTPARELAKDRPDLIRELARRIKALQTVSWITNPTDRTGQADPTTPVGIAGRTLGGRYRLEELIAEGGFAEVYRAYDTELQRTVAVKIPKRTRLQSTEAFLAEARRVARLKHDGIVPVYDVGVEDDTCFIVSEFLEGGSLADRLTAQKPSKEETLRWISEVADALEYAHIHGIVHRDVKPANILLDHHGRAKLADFGIAQSSMKTGELAPSLGTLRYMSPEQLQGQPADHRSDIYSLGLVLHETLTGKLPYSSPEPSVIRREIVEGRVNFSPSIPSPLVACIRKATSRSPHVRHASAGEFGSELRRASIGDKNFSWKRGGAFLLLLTAVGGALPFVIPNKRPPANHPTEEQPGVISGDFRFAVGADGVTITQYLGTATDVVIPETIQGKKVVTIGSDVFKNRQDISTIDIPKTVTSIGNMTFYRCASLKSITLPPNLTSIGFNAFEGCFRLPEITIPASVAKIGVVCFIYSHNLKNIVVDPSNRDYTSVDGILYSKNITTLIACPAGKRGVVVIPDSVTTIKEWSFAGCDKLERIVIPKTVTRIGANAFVECDAIRDVAGE